MAYPRRLMGLIAILLTVAGASPDRALAGETLRWKFLSGQKFDVQFSRVEERTLKGDGGEWDERSECAINGMWNIESVDNRGTADVTMTIDHVRVKSHSPDGDVSIDSRKAAQSHPADAAPQAEVIKSFISKFRIRFTVDKHGLVLAAKPNDEAVKQIMRIMPMISRKSDPFSEKGMRATVQQMLLILPESPLEKGGEWRHSLELNQPKEGGSRKVEVRYRYVGPARYKGSTVEKIVSRATFDGGKFSAGGALANVVAELNSGVVYFDNTAGRLVEEEDTQKRTVEYTKSGRTAREEVKIVSRVEIRDRIRNGDGHGGDRVQTDASPKPQR